MCPDSRGLREKSDCTAVYQVSTFNPAGNVTSHVGTPLFHLPVLLRHVTCESDQLNPDHQLCLTYFIFGAIGFLAFVPAGLVRMKLYLA